MLSTTCFACTALVPVLIGGSYPSIYTNCALYVSHISCENNFETSVVCVHHRKFQWCRYKQQRRQTATYPLTAPEITVTVTSRACTLQGSGQNRALRKRLSTHLFQVAPRRATALLGSICSSLSIFSPVRPRQIGKTSSQADFPPDSAFPEFLLEGHKGP